MAYPMSGRAPDDAPAADATTNTRGRVSRGDSPAWSADPRKDSGWAAISSSRRTRVTKRR